MSKVHVYRVAELHVVDVGTRSYSEAMQYALDEIEAGRTSPLEPSCMFVAVFPGGQVRSFGSRRRRAPNAQRKQGSHPDEQ